MTTPDQTALLLENARLREALGPFSEGFLYSMRDEFGDETSVRVINDHTDAAKAALSHSPDHFARGAELIRNLVDAAKPYATDCGCAAGCNRCALLKQALKDLEEWEAGK